MIHVQNASLTLVNTTIKDNACSQPDQGRTGITLEGQTGRIHIKDSNFVNNSHTRLEAPVLYIAGKTNATTPTPSSATTGLNTRCGQGP